MRAILTQKVRAAILLILTFALIAAYAIARAMHWTPFGKDRVAINNTQCSLDEKDLYIGGCNSTL